MPVYNFQCKVCGEDFEKTLSFSQDQTQVTCPRGHQAARRIYAVPTVVFKGKGFYVTDHRKTAPSASTK